MRRGECDDHIGRDRRIIYRVLTYFKFDVREVVEVGRVVDGLDLDRYGGRPFSDVLPVDATEERYRWPEVVDAAAAVPETAVWFATEPGDGVACLLTDGHLGWEAQRLPPIHNLPVRLLRVFAAERRIPCKRTRPISNGMGNVFYYYSCILYHIVIIVVKILLKSPDKWCVISIHNNTSTAVAVWGWKPL